MSDSYPDVSPQPDLPRIEAEILDYWQRNDVFGRSVSERSAGVDGDNEYVFYDGPPFANGLPHYGHLLTGYVKDAVPRYRTMRGQRVERRFGWDCHGLPAEVQTEKELGIAGHPEITAYGIEAFNDACRSSVLRFTDEWQDYVNRQARWVDFDNDYKTLDIDYMESVMWAFAELHRRGLVYEGYRVLWYCTRCETPLSNSETKQDDAYRARQDPAVTVSLPIVAPGDALDGASLLVWTTTPWTLPSNLAAAVHPTTQYSVVESTGEAAGRYVLASDLVGAYRRELGEEPTVVATFAGSELVGTHYGPPFDFFAGRENAFQVLAADYVTTDSGTGIVHIAPAFGEEDKEVTDAAGIEAVNPVDDSGRFTAEVSPYAGQHVFDANRAIISDLKAEGRLLRHETYEHNYPHCWRCDQPLIQRAVSSWFVAVSQFVDRMVELNQQITWVPSHIRDGQFGKWLENARDWNISRNRFWGSPIPVWKSDDPDYPRIDVYGSIAELEADFGRPVTDLHRPLVDDLVRPNPDDPTGKSMMRRVPEVLDCWFESGSMPFAQVHYPFENQEWFDHHYPGDFIVEYIGQTRGWFYTLHVLATALFDRPSFNVCVSHGIVLGDDGRKMSKSLQNYPDPREMFDTYGADAMRWYLLSSPILRGADFSVNETGLRDTVRQRILPIWNAYYFLTLYANAAGVRGRFRTDQTDVLDRYLLGELHRLVADVEAQLDRYDLYAAYETIGNFVDTLTNWYIRRSRPRFWAGETDAIDTLHTALVTLCTVAAPLVPMIAEEVYRGIVDGADSVHLLDWPDADAFGVDDDLAAGMATVREACSALLSLRKAHGLRVRLPLTAATVAVERPGLVEPHLDIMRDELNVKSVTLTDDVAGLGERQLVLHPRELGPRLGGKVQDVIKAHKSGDWAADGDAVIVGGVELLPGEFEFRVVSADDRAAAPIDGGRGMVELDIVTTPELELEGIARDMIRQIQQQRRVEDLDVSDRIALVVAAPSAEVAAVEAFRDLVMSETLATEMSTEHADEVSISVSVVARGPE